MEGWMVDGIKCIGYRISAVAETDLIVNWQQWWRDPIVRKVYSKKEKKAGCLMHDA